MPNPSNKFTWDLGNIIAVVQLVVLILTGAAVWNAMDKRVLVLEEFRLSQRERDMNQDQASKEKAAEVKEALKDIGKKIDKLTDTVIEQRVADSRRPVVPGPAGPAGKNFWGK